MAARCLTGTVKGFFAYLALATLVAGASVFGFQNANAAPGNQRLKVPQLTGEVYFNAKESPRLALGEVTLLHYWTFACHNCQANFPAYNRIQKEFESKGLKIIGVHTPELAFERKVENVEKAIGKHGIKWPVLLDEKGLNWTRWRLEYWPTVFVVDRKGEVRFKWEGELAWQGRDGEKQINQVIQKLLAEK
jgi:thiol-disulfide isomerase/thioredoxin